jgi:hypothetical protein
VLTLPSPWRGQARSRRCDPSSESDVPCWDVSATSERTRSADRFVSTDRRHNPASSLGRAAASLAACRTGTIGPKGEPTGVAKNDVADSTLAGRFHSTTLIRHRPRTLGTWQVTTISPPMADRVVRLLGGRILQDSATSRPTVLTAASTVAILLPGPDAMWIGWQRSADGICNGVTQDDGQPCGCPVGLAARRTAAKRGRGCPPHVELRFMLADDPSAGVFGFTSEDWLVVEVAGRLKGALEDSCMPMRARLELERTLHKLPSGRVLACTRPVIALDKRET